MRYEKLLVLLIAVPLLCALPTAGLGQDFDNYVQKALADSTFAWRTISSDGVRIFYQEHSFAERHRMMLLRSATEMVNEVLKLLDEQAYEPQLNVFYLSSRDEMARIVGHTYSGYADWSGPGIFVVMNPEWRSFEKHEFTHVVTMGLWGPPDDTSRWMIEGISIYSDGWCREYSVDDIASYLLANDQLPSLQELFGDYSKLGEIRAGFSAASFIEFIRNTYGIAAVRSLWSGGVSHLADLLGDDLTHIEDSWRRSVKQNERPDVHVDFEAITASGCG
jgi:hypothetical protein